MNGAADINILPLPIRSIDLAPDCQSECKAGAISERQAHTLCNGSQIGSETCLRFGERFDAREQTEDDPGAWSFHQSEIVYLAPDLGEIHRAHCGAFENFQHVVVELLILQYGKENGGV